MLTILSLDRRSSRVTLSFLIATTLLLVGSLISAAAEPDTNQMPPALEEESGVVARVNGEALYLEDVEGVLGKIHEGQTGQVRSDFDIDEMMFRLVNDTLLSQEARALGMAEDPNLVNRLEARRAKMARQRIEREEVFEKLKFDEEELKRTYLDGYRAATIRILTRKDKSEAEDILQQLEQGADFEALISEQSQDPYSMRQGLIQNLPAIDMPGNLSEVVFTMAPGDLGGPAATGYGWTIFRVEDFSPADPDQFEKRKRDVRNYLRFGKEEALRSQLLAELRHKYPVELVDSVYEAIVPKIMPDGRILPEIEDPEAVVATAGERGITAATYGKSLAARWSNIANIDIAQAIKPIMLDRLLVDEMLALEAKSRGYEISPEVERAVHSLETQLLVQQYLEEIVQPRVKITQEDLVSYYETNRDRYRRPPKLHVSQLTVESEELARRLAKMIEEGTDFAWLARQHSIDGHRDSGGAVGWVPANQGITGFTAELLDAKAGDVFGPVDFRGEWRIVRVDLLEPQKHYEFEEVSGNVRQQVETLEFLEIVDALIKELRRRSQIWINDEALAAMQIQATPDTDNTPTAPGHG